MMNSNRPAKVAPSGCSLTSPPALKLRRRRWSLGDGTETGRTRHAGAAETTVAVRVLREILLVVILGVIELRSRGDFRGNRPVAGLRQRALILVARAFCRGALRVTVVIDAGPILRSDVVSLTHPLRGIVALPEHL